MIQQTEKRAVSTVIGFLLLIALISILFTFYLSAIVPQASEQAEVQTRFDLFEDMNQLQGDIDRAANTDGTVESTIRTKVEYSTLISAFATPSTYEYSQQTGNAQLNNANNSSTDFFESTTDWSSDIINIDINNRQTLSTNSQVGFEYGIPYNQINQNQYAENNGLVSDTNIKLYLVDANLGIARGTTDDSVYIDSTSFQTTETEDDGTPLELQLETTISEQAWNEALESEKTSNGGHITDITYTAQTNDLNTVKIEFEQGITYDITVGRATITSN
jgi:hypothetical protein